MTNEAVVVIDVQNAILSAARTERQAANHAALDAVVARIAELIGRAREQGVPVLFVQHDGAQGTFGSGCAA